MRECEKKHATTSQVWTSILSLELYLLHPSLSVHFLQSNTQERLLLGVPALDICELGLHLCDACDHEGLSFLSSGSQRNQIRLRDVDLDVLHQERGSSVWPHLIPPERLTPQQLVEAPETQHLRFTGELHYLDSHHIWGMFTSS